MKRNHTKLPILLALGLAAVGFNVANGDTINVPLDYATIQAAINAAATDDEIIVAAGTYAESITLSKKLTIKGANAGVAAGANPGVRGAETVIDGGFIVSVSGATIDGVTIQNGLLSGSMRVGVAVSASDVTVTNTVIQNVGVAPVTAQSDGLSTQPGNNNLTLTNSTIQNNWRGIYLNPGSGHVISGNLITANNGVGVGIGSDGQSNLTLSGNTISNHTLEGWGASAVGTGVVASGNSFLNNGVSVAHYGGSAINASNNYWGSASGPGSTVSGNVVTLPYYTDASLTTLGAPVTNTTQNTFFATIQAAINAATAGDTITVSAGTYSEGPISLNKAVILQGPNAGLAGTALTRGPEARIENSSITVTAAATIDGFEIYQTNNAENGVLVQAAATVTNSVIRRYAATDHSPANTVFSRGLSTSVGLVGYMIVDNLFTGDDSNLFSTHKTWNSGIYINGGTGTISGNTFENCRTAANLDDFNAGIAVAGNAFKNCGTYISFGGTSPINGQFTIAGNDFTVPSASAIFNNSNVAATFRINAIGNTWNGIAPAALTDAQKFAIEAQMYHRGRSGRNGVVDFVQNEQVVVLGLTTITSAVNAAAAGDTVLVSAGNSAESVGIAKPLTLKGANHGVPAADGTGIAPAGRGPESVMTNGGPVVFSPTSDNITIDGFKFTGPSGRLIDSYANTNNLQILNCVFDIPSGAGDGGVVQLDSGSRNGLVIKNNRFGGAGTSSWLYLGGPANADHVIEGNDFVGTGSRAIFHAGSGYSNTLIKGNYIGSGIVTGFNLGQLETPIIEGNTFMGVQYAAMQIGSFNGGFIRDNHLDGSGSGYYFAAPYDYTLAYGIMLWGGAWGTQASEGMTIQGNTVVNYLNPSPSAGDSFAAIYLTADAGPDIEILENTLEGNSTAIRVNSDESGIKINENTMVGNTVALWNQKGVSIDGEKNHWGAPNPDFNLVIDGTGVDYSPGMPTRRGPFW
jgi:parallel beta-helix repeat protein